MLQFCTNSYALLNTTYNHHMQPAAAQCRSKKQQKNSRYCFATFSGFRLTLLLTFLAPWTAVTNVMAVCALQTIACEHHAASCLEIKHLLHELAFVLSRGQSSICEKISQFGTTKVATKQYCNMHQNDNCCSMTRAVARQAVLCVLN